MDSSAVSFNTGHSLRSVSSLDLMKIYCGSLAIYAFMRFCTIFSPSNFLSSFTKNTFCNYIFWHSNHLISSWRFMATGWLLIGTFNTVHRPLYTSFEKIFWNLLEPFGVRLVQIERPGLSQDHGHIDPSIFILHTNGPASWWILVVLANLYAAGQNRCSSK